jgi:hypothetical protein
MLKSNKFFRNLVYGFILLLIILACFVVYKLIRLQGFRVLNTNPSANSVAELTPFFDINFNERIAKNVIIKSTNGLIKNYKVQGKSLDIFFNYPTSDKNTYYINIPKISSVTNKTIYNINYDFNPQNLPESSLPEDQQKFLINAQDQHQYLTQNIEYKNTSALINFGFSSTQLAEIENYIESFDNKAKIVIFGPTINIANPGEKPSTTYEFSASFNITIGGANYSALVVCFNPSSSTIQLSNSSGQNVFSSSKYAVGF